MFLEAAQRTEVADAARRAVFVRDALAAPPARAVAARRMRVAVAIVHALHAAAVGLIAEAAVVAVLAIGIAAALDADLADLVAGRCIGRTDVFGLAFGTRRDAAAGGGLADFARRAILAPAALDAAVQCRVAARFVRVDAIRVAPACDAGAGDRIAVQRSEPAFGVALAGEPRLRGRIGIRCEVQRAVASARAEDEPQREQLANDRALPHAPKRASPTRTVNAGLRIARHGETLFATGNLRPSP